LSLSWAISVVQGFSATAGKKQKLRPISSFAPASKSNVLITTRYSGGGAIPARANSTLYQSPAISIKYSMTCSDINPQAGNVIQHDQIGDTWYDCQQHGSMGRMISVTSGGYRHFSWTYTDGPYPGVARGVYANCKDPSGGYLGVATVAYSATTKPGYCNQTHLHTGHSLVIYHEIGPPTTKRASMISKGSVVCGGFFTMHWDIPDSITGCSSGEPGMWPKAEVLYDDASGRDYIHIVLIEGKTLGGRSAMVAYERCYFGTDDSVICEAYNSGTKRYAIKNDVPGPGSLAPISHFDSSCNITPVLAVSPVSRRVAIVFLKPADPNGSCLYGSDVCYIESMNNGDDWISGSPWPPPEGNITHYGITGNERAYNDLNVCYDFQDSLHLVYVTCGFDSALLDYYDPEVARLYHWSKKDGVTMITSAIWGGTAPGENNANIAKMSISAQDPIYHPGGDSVYLFCIWTQFDPGDTSVSGYGNGDIYGCVSNNGGMTWDGVSNLTHTKTPDCVPGACLSEHWSSLAANMYNGDLHIQYICDRDPGTALPNLDPGSTWHDNPVMYLDLGWGHSSYCRIDYRIDDPPGWYNPPLKVIPGGFRNLIFKLFNSGTANCVYSVSSDDPCIQVNVPNTNLPPGDSASVTVIIDGSGTCISTFIDGNVILTTNEGGGRIDSLPVQAVVANAYYECPQDPQTVDSLDNGVLTIYLNANGQERMHDVSALASGDTFDVFLNGGTIVATTRDKDTLVGRYMGGNDQHNLAGEKLYINELPSKDFRVVYTWSVFMHDFDPPVDVKWYWWELSQEIVFFKPTASDDLKHTVIKFVTVERHDPPIWWPEHPAFVSYDNTYIGMAMDIDCPNDTLGTESGRNLAGYDSTNNIAWQKGFGRAGEHPQYDNYYAGIALAQGKQLGEDLVPYGAFNVKNHQYLYPRSPWGWKDQELYQLSAASGYHIQDPDSLLDRSQVFTARKIDAGSNPKARSSFTLIEAIAPANPKEDLAQLQQFIAEARSFVQNQPVILCGDINNSGSCELGDVVSLISYLYKSGPPPTVGPLLRADGNTSGQVELGDVVTLISYLYKNGPAPLCPGIW